MKKLFSLIALLLLTLASRPILARDGNEGGHGGDAYALEFVTIGTALADHLAELEKKDPTLFRKWNFTTEEFRRVVLGNREFKPTRVVSKERVYLRKEEVEATNDDHEGLIVLSRSAWREKQLLERVRLTLHEYFGILGVEQDRFDASIDFASFTIAVTQALSKRSDQQGFMANLFYGYATSYPALSDLAICDIQSPRIQSAIASATAQAKAHCDISNGVRCQAIMTSFNEVLSLDVIGMKYCEVLVLMR